MSRARLRDLGITIGEHPPGPNNAITDVPGGLVGHTTLIYDAPRVARTGVSVVVPRAGEIHADHCAAAFHAFNGNGELTGSHWVAEAGLLGTPIAITNTHQVGVVRDALVAHEVAINPQVAQRATVGLARVGGEGYNGSGDLFFAFATGNHIPADAQAPIPLQMLPHGQMNGLLEATAEAVEEAILNALCAAETMTGFQGRTVHALPLDELLAIWKREREDS